MKAQGSARASSAPSLLGGLAVLAIALFGLVNLTGRPAIRAALAARPIAGVDSFEVRGPSDLRFALSRKAVGDPVEIRFGPDGGPAAVRDTIVPYYSQRSFPLALVLMAGLSFLAGFAVLAFRPGDRRARIFYWLSLCFGATVMIGGGTYGLQGKTLHLLPGILFNAAYPMTLALLLRFAQSYAPPRRRARPALFWAVPAFWAVVLNATFLAAELGPSLAAYRLCEVFKHVFRIYVVAAGVAALVEFSRALRHTASAEDRTQIKWYLIGLAAGLGPYLALNQLPLIVTDRPLLADNFALFFFLLVPVFTVLAILQFRLLRVNVVFHRGLVYSILTVFTLAAFLFLVDALRRLFPRATATGDFMIMAGTAAVVAVLLSPGRKAVQNFIDRLFFPQSYEYRMAIRGFERAAPAIVGAEALLALFQGTVERVPGVGRLGVRLDGADAAAGIAPLRFGSAPELAGDLDDLTLDPGKIWAVPGRIHAVEGVDLTRERELRAAGADVAMALPRAAGAPQGLLAFGPKVSGHRFTKEDLGLLETLAGETALNLGRIRIQEAMIYERASREKSEELVRLKTEFVSSVAHELRTPVTSLSGLSELLRSGKVTEPGKRDRLLALLAGECGRLTRFLRNVLEFGKIESDARAYDLRETDLEPLVREVVDLVRESQPDGGAELRFEGPGRAVRARVDGDAVRQALLNLLDNALKYSPGRTAVTARLTEAEEAVTIAVEDRGLGIDPEDRERIFEAFFRTRRAAEHDPTGVGLGLRIVRHIMDAHGGRVEVASEAGRGSVFSLVFPSGSSE